MAELKSLGSEKLKGDEKLKRILELTYYKGNNTSSQKPELVKESKIGGVYGIVREKDVYYVKRGLNEQSLDYIGGMFMKNKNKFNSYGDALKRLELIKGQEELQEATKYVLKQNKPQEEAPMAEPSMDIPPAPSPEASDSEMPPAPGMENEPSPEGEQSSPEGGEMTGKRSDYMAEVQKFSGKLGQELRDLHDRMESDDIKYVLNMIISAVDLDKLDIEDIEEIGKKFERDEENGEGMGSEDFSSEDDVPAEEPTPDEDLGEDGMNALDNFINSDAPSDKNEINLSQYNDLGDENVHEEDETKEIDLDEIKNEIHRSIGETLSKYFK